MAKTTWFDRLLSLRRPGRASADEEVEGLVLSGGGSRASFHIGALRYLYDICHISPTSITATSCGSICAAMLAQSLDPAVQSANLGVLEEYWLAMSDPSEMYSEQSWFTKLREQWGDISGVIPDATGSDPAFVDTSGSDAEHLVKEAIISDPSLHDSEFSLSSMWQVLGALPRLGKVGTGMAGILRGAEHASSAYRPGPIVHRLLFESGFDADNVRTSGMKLRMAFVGLQSGELRFMREDGIIVNSDNKPIETTPFDLALGVWASCAIPGVFRPVKLGDDMYIDGGTRENLPVEMAVNGLSVTKPYVIDAIPPGVPYADFTDKNMVSILVRALGLLMDETTRDEVEWARHAGATVIAPEYEVHGSMVVERGLLRINRDYGWMRAAEELTGNGGNASVHAYSSGQWQSRDVELTGNGGNASVHAYSSGQWQSRDVELTGNGGNASVHAYSSEQSQSRDVELTGVSGSLPIVLARVDLYNARKGTDADQIVAAREKLRTLLSEADPGLLPEGYEGWPDETWV